MWGGGAELLSGSNMRAKVCYIVSESGRNSAAVHTSEQCCLDM
jgi:hypothetical protein